MTRLRYSDTTRHAILQDVQRSLHQISFVRHPSATLVVDTLISLYDAVNGSHSQGIVHILRGFSSMVPLETNPSQNAIVFTQFLELSAPYLLLPQDSIIADLALFFSQTFSSYSPELAKHLEEELYGTPLWSTFLFQSLGASRIADPRLWASFWSNVMQRAALISTPVNESAKVLYSFILTCCNLFNYVYLQLGITALEEFLSASFITWDIPLTKFLQETPPPKGVIDDAELIKRLDELVPPVASANKSFCVSDTFRRVTRAATYPLTRRRQPEGNIYSILTSENQPSGLVGLINPFDRNDQLERVDQRYGNPDLPDSSHFDRPDIVMDGTICLTEPGEVVDNSIVSTENGTTTTSDCYIPAADTQNDIKSGRLKTAATFTFKRRRRNVRRPSTTGPTLADWAPKKILLLPDGLLPTLDDLRDDWSPSTEHLTLLIGERETGHTSATIVQGIPVSRSVGGYFYSFLWSDEVPTILSEIEQRTIRVRGSKPLVIDSRMGRRKLSKPLGWFDAMRNLFII